MNLWRVFLVGLLLVLCVQSVEAQEYHEFRRTDGQTLYGRVHQMRGSLMVVIITDKGRTYHLPMRLLVDEDQAYVRQQWQMIQQREASRPQVHGRPGREWTDNQGRKIAAIFHSIQGEQVRLETNTGLLTVPFGSLSQSDQQHVREQLSRRGQSHLIPGQNGNPSSSTASRPSSGFGSSTGGGVSPPTGQPPRMGSSVPSQSSGSRQRDPASMSEAWSRSSNPGTASGSSLFGVPGLNLSMIMVSSFSLLALVGVGFVVVLKAKKSRAF
ncbi:hypothetical protein GC197_10335 [bacterium]|nr:hypothetical protein [bacterium]